MSNAEADEAGFMTMQHAHRWNIERYEDGISKGTCKVPGCGAVRYFPNQYEKDLVKKADELNRKAGHAPATRPAVRIFNEHSVTEKKEENMQDPNQAQVQNIENLPPVPTRPDVTKITKGERGKIFGQYYARNKEQILKEFNQLPPEEQDKFTNRMTIRWGITETGWRVIRARWMPDRFSMPSWYGKNNKNKPASSAPATKHQEPAKEKSPHCGANVLPAFPDFSDKWPGETQVEWFRTYKELVAMK